VLAVEKAATFGGIGRRENGCRGKERIPYVGEGSHLWGVRLQENKPPEKEEGEKRNPRSKGLGTITPESL